MPTDSKGFFAALFDFEFTTFITVKFVKLIYIVLMVVLFLSAALSFLLALVAGLSEGGSPRLILVALIFIPLITLVYLVFLRLFMEAIVVFFRIGESTSAMAAALPAPAGRAGASSPAYGTPPSAGGGPGGDGQPRQPSPESEDPGPTSSGTAYPGS